MKITSDDKEMSNQNEWLVIAVSLTLKRNVYSERVPVDFQTNPTRFFISCSRFGCGLVVPKLRFTLIFHAAASISRSFLGRQRFSLIFFFFLLNFDWRAIYSSVLYLTNFACFINGQYFQNEWIAISSSIAHAPNRTRFTCCWHHLFSMRFFFVPNCNVHSREALFNVIKKNKKAKNVKHRKANFMVHPLPLLLHSLCRCPFACLLFPFFDRS